MHLEATQTFIRLYKKLPPDLKKRAQKALEGFQSNPAHPSLVHKKMAGQRDIYELRVSQNYCVTYKKIGDTVYLRKIGSHDLFA